MDPKTRAAIMEVERRLQAACVAVKVCLETHVREEAELWPLFEKHFTSAEQGRLVGLIIGRTGAEVLQSMLSWQRKALTEEEKAARIGSMRDASRNTRFASWLETWWSSEEQTAGTEGGEDLGAKTAGNEMLTETNDGRATTPESTPPPWTASVRCRSTFAAEPTGTRRPRASPRLPPWPPPPPRTRAGIRRAGTTCSA